MPEELAHRLLLNTLFFLSVLTLVIFFLLQSKWELASKIMLYFDGEQYFSNNFYRSNGPVVAKGIFSEPSTLGIYFNLSLAYLWHVTGYINRRANYFKYSTIVLCIILSLSLTAYVLLVANTLFLVRKRKIAKFFAIYFLSIVVIMLMLLLLSDLELVERTIANRLSEKVVYGKDDSTMARLFGSWEVPLLIIQQYPILGVGLGNVSVFSSQITSELTYGLYGKDGFVTFAYVLGAPGIVGLALFIGMVLQPILKNTPAGLIYLLTMFGFGGFTEPIIWVFYALFTVDALKRKSVSFGSDFSALGTVKKY